jgi:hypothetical protein
MKWLVALFLLAASSAMAQQMPMAKTLPLVNNTTKEKIGTATFSGRSIYLRDLKGEHFATVTVEKDGSRTLTDANGKVTDTLPPPPKKEDKLLDTAVPQHAK